MSNITRIPEIERFTPKYTVTGAGCWEWTAARTVDGYGTFYFWDYVAKAKRTRAHRFAYQYFIGPIPSGMELDHLCRNRACVNPDHLEPVTTRENAHRGLNTVVHPELRSRTDKTVSRVCSNGHWVDVETAPRDRDGYLKCRACDRDRSRQGMRRRRAAAKIAPQ